MRLPSLIAALAAVSLSCQAIAQSTAEPAFTAERFRSHVAFLADDLLEGRNTGERGYDIAARYVATQFEGLGLKPAAGGSWYQEVPFVEYKLGAATPSISIGGKALEIGKDAVIGGNPLANSTALEAGVVFAGYGLDAPALGQNDYAGLDVRGKLVAVLTGTPAGLASDTAAHLNSQKRDVAARRGAAGLIMIEGPSAAGRNGFARLAAAAGRPQITWVGPDGRANVALPFEMGLSRTGAEALFAGAPRSYAQVLETAAKGKVKGFALKPRVKVERQSEVKPIASRNVVAMLPGSDPALANEYVLMMGHLDHVGINPAAPGEDKINNGAMDNATGISTLLEAARAMVESGQRPRRSILFAAVTAEEKGLLGSQYLAKHPVVEGGKVVGVVNLDMPVLLYDFQDVIAFGAEHSTLGPIVERAGAKMGVGLTPDPLPQEGLFTRSDHYRFVQEGIPSVFLMTGFANGGQEKFTGFLATNYHSPADEVDQAIDWNAGAKFARLNYLIAREIADADQAPRWYQGSFFGNSFAPAQPKAAKP